MKHYCSIFNDVLLREECKTLNVSIGRNVKVISLDSSANERISLHKIW